MKHRIHKSHFLCVPTPNVLVERRSISKHRIHINHFSCVPLRNVAVECTFMGKAVSCSSSIATHIRHQTHVPIRHRPVPNVFRSSPDYTFSSLRNRCRFSQTFRDESTPARVWDWRWTFARIRRTSDGVGARKFRLKRSCAGKHVGLRRRRCGSGPRGNVVVECRSETKHRFHISHLRCVPTPNVLVERKSFFKHSSQSHHLRCIPTPNVLVERRSFIKHIMHISHLRCVPIPNVLVERRSFFKHSSHSHHLRCIPTPNVLVERRSFIKHNFHISHFFCSPIPNVLVERRSGVKHISHISHFFCVPLRNVAVECTFSTKALKTSIISTHIFHQTRIPIRHRAVIITRCPSSALASYRSFIQTLRDEIMPALFWDWCKRKWWWWRR